MALKIGDKAPDFMLPATFNRFIRLNEYHGKNVVIVFFPLAWTPI